MKTKRITQKSSEIRSGFFKRINKIDKPVAKLNNGKRRPKSTNLEIKRETVQQYQ